MKIKKSHIIYGILFVIFIFAMLPWLKQGVPGTDDYVHHAMRFWFIGEQISLGEYSEWMPYIYGGWPFFHYYHPMFYIISLPAVILFGAIASLKVMTIIAYAIALFGTFYAGKLLFKDDEAALVAAAAYFLSSHFLFHATVSGALPRLTAIALTPLVLAFFIKALEENSKKTTLISGILLAVLALMHTSVAVVALAMCFIYTAYKFYLQKDIKMLVRPTIILLIVVGLSAAWLFPLMLEKQHANLPEEQEKLDAPIFKQSLRTFGITHDGKNYIRSNYFGYAVAALSLLGLFFIKNSRTANFMKIGLVASVVFYFNIFGILNIVPFVKTALTGSTSFFISAVVFNAAMLAGVASKALGRITKKGWLVYIIAAIIIIELYPGANAFSYGWVGQKTDNFVNPQRVIESWDYIKQQEGDFVVLSLVGKAPFIYHGKREFGFDWMGCPQCVQKETYNIHYGIWKNLTEKGMKNDELLGYFGVKYYVLPCQENTNSVEAFSKEGICVYENEKFMPLIESHAEITKIEYELDKVSFAAETEKDADVIVKINNFKPHWKAYVNGKETEIKDAWPEFMMITVPAGENNVVIDYKTNTKHIASWFITLLTMLLVAYFIRS